MNYHNSDKTSVLVTGGAGHVASQVIPALCKAGYAVTAVVRPGSDLPVHLFPASGVKVVPCELSATSDIRDLVAEQSPDVIASLAVNRSTSVGQARVVNHDVVAVLADYACRTGAHLVHAGSSLEYGIHNVAMDETTECRPESALGISKLAASQLVGEMVATKGMRGVTLRIFHAYGRNEQPSRLIPTALEAAFAGLPLPMTASGFAHDLVWIEDIVAAFLTLIANGTSRATPIDACTGISTTTETVVDLIEELIGRQITRVEGAFAARAWDRPVWTGNPHAFTKLLGREPTALRLGLAELVAARRNQRPQK